MKHFGKQNVQIRRMGQTFFPFIDLCKERTEYDWKTSSKETETYTEGNLSGSWKHWIWNYELPEVTQGSVRRQAFVMTVFNFSFTHNPVMKSIKNKDLIIKGINGFNSIWITIGHSGSDPQKGAITTVQRGSWHILVNMVTRIRAERPASMSESGIISLLHCIRTDLTASVI
jgi:hypothetical protein